MAKSVVSPLVLLCFPGDIFKVEKPNIFLSIHFHYAFMLAFLMEFGTTPVALIADFVVIILENLSLTI